MIQQTSQPRPITQPFSSARRAAVLLGVSAFVSIAMTGCGIEARTVPTAVSTQGLHLTGHARGGQQPVSGSVIQLYRAGSGGNGSAATPMISSVVTTDANGGFSITGDYTCSASTDQMYITATAGNPGLAPGTSNPALELVTALGDCGSLASITGISLNEITTSAAAWALAPFAVNATSIGASASNATGLRNAMQTAMMLADPYTGAAPAAALPANAQTESAKLLTLADILAACVNSSGTSACSSLFADAQPASGPAVYDTFMAALAVAGNPGHNTAAIFGHLPAQLAYAGALPTAPNDWTMSIAYTGGGLNLPAGVAVDPAGDAWVIGGAGTLSGFTPQGTPISATGFSGGSLFRSYSLAIDSSSNIWIANQEASASFVPGPGSAVEFSSQGALLSGPNGYTGNSMNLPVATAADAAGNVWFANYANSSFSLFGPGATNLTASGAFGQGSLLQPTALAIDTVGNAWIASGTGSQLMRFGNTGYFLGQVTCCVSADTLAIDSAGNLWAGSSQNNQVTGVTPAGSMLASLSMAAPQTVEIDSGDHVWITSASSGNLTEVAGTNSGQTVGSLLSPASGFGLDARLVSPYGVAVDASGDLWVSSFGDNRLLKFVGLATPVKTPKAGPAVQP